MQRRPFGATKLGRRVARRMRAAVRRLEAEDRPFDRLVWQFSTPRAGSTWLATLLATNEIVRGVNEPLLGAHLGVRMRSTVDVTLQPREELVHDWARANDAYIFNEATEPEWLPILQDLVRARLMARLPDQDWPRGLVVVKEPHGAQAAPLLTRLTPSSRVLFLIRDPRDVAVSALEIEQHGMLGQSNGRGILTPPERRKAVERMAWFWQWRVRAIERAVEALPGDQSMLVRYEDLTADTAGVLTSIGSWLGLHEAANWAQSAAEQVTLDANAPSRPREASYERGTSGNWTTHLLPEEQVFLNEHLEPFLARYDYADGVATDAREQPSRQQ